MLCFLRLRLRWRLLLTVLGLGFRVLLKNTSLITRNDSTKQVWFSLKTLDDVLTHLHAALLLIIIQQSWHHFFADFSHVQIFDDNLPSTVLFHVQLTCYHSKSQPTITTQHLPYPHNVEGLSLLESTFTPLRHYLNLFAIEKHVCTTWGYLHTHPEAFQVLVTKFSPSG